MPEGHVDFATITPYVGDHKRAQRLVAGLSAREDLGETTLNNLRRECRRSGIDFRVVDGKIVPEAGQEMALLQILDRRRYALMLVDGRWEQYEAPSRKAAGVRVEQAAQPAPARRAPRARTGRARA